MTDLDRSARELTTEARSAWSRRYRASLDRVVPDSVERTQQVERFAAFVGSELNPDPHMDTHIGPAPAIATDVRLTRVLLERLTPVRTLSVEVRDGCRIVGTPYDEEWAVGGGLAFMGRFTGEVAIFGQDGISAAGVGVHLRSDHAVDVSLTPAGTYDFSVMAAAQEVEDFSSRGGLAVTVYQGGEARPAYSRRIALWDVRGSRLPRGPLGAFGQGVAGTGSIAGASSPTAPGGFGPYPLAPVFLALGPGRELLVWVWSWLEEARAENVFSTLVMKMPAFTVCASGPQHLR